MSERAEAFLKAQGIAPDEDSVKHYGVPGMKWGIRKRRSSGSSGPKSSSKSDNSSKPGKAATVKKSNSFSSKPNNRRLTDAELRKKLDRIRMEQDLARLTAPKPKTRDFVKQVLADSGKEATKKVASKATQVLIQLALEKAAERSTGANKVFFTAMAETGGKKKKNN